MSYDGIHYTCAIHQIRVNIKTKKECIELDCNLMNTDNCWLNEIFDNEKKRTDFGLTSGDLTGTPKLSAGRTHTKQAARGKLSSWVCAACFNII